MQNNSKLNTVLLMIAVVLLGAVLIMLVGKKNEAVIERTDTFKEEKNNENVTEKKVEKSETQLSFLKDLLIDYPDSRIFECNLSGKVYYYTSPDKVSDSGSHLIGGASIIYYTNGKEISCPMNPMVEKDPLCNQKVDMCKVIYASEKSFDGGIYDDGIDVYGLK